MTMSITPYATGVKTGSLIESDYCISATATYDGYSYLVICMGSPYIDSEGNHIDYHGEMYDAATLFRWAFLNIENKTLVTDGELLGEVSLKYAWGKDHFLRVWRRTANLTQHCRAVWKAAPSPQSSMRKW